MLDNTSNTTGDKLSKRSADARYKRSERLIRRALCEILANRRLTVSPTEVCQAANLTKPTFYTHFKNKHGVIRDYEHKLVNEFADRLQNKTGQREVLFTVLLRFIRDEQHYFSATITNADYWLLNTIFVGLKDTLGSKCTNKKVYEVYIQAQIAIICCWVKYENYAPQKIPHYVQKLKSTRLQDLGL